MNSFCQGMVFRRFQKVSLEPRRRRCQSKSPDDQEPAERSKRSGKKSCLHLRILRYWVSQFTNQSSCGMRLRPPRQKRMARPLKKKARCGGDHL